MLVHYSALKVEHEALLLTDRINIDRRRILAGALATTIAGGAARAAPLSKIDVGEVLRRRVDAEKRTVGIAAAIVTPDGDRIVCYGRQKLVSDGKISAETLF